MGRLADLMAIAVRILEGNQRKITATFLVPGLGADLNDPTTWTPTDPSTITFTRIRDGSPDATLEAFLYPADLTRVSAGVYETTLDFPNAGTFIVGAQGTGAVEAYDEVAVVITRAKAKTPS